MQPNQPLPQEEAESTYYQQTDGEQQDTDVVDGPATLPQIEPVQWRAIEYIQHVKSPIWYVVFALIVLALMGIAIFLMQAWTFAILIPVMAGALIMYAHRPPRELSYALTEKGIYINDQLHPLDAFKAFGIIKLGDNLNNLVLIPVKRFGPGLTVYFPSEVGEQIVDILGGFIPMQDVKPDAFDAIVQKLRM